MKTLLEGCKITRVLADGAGTASATPTKGTIIDMAGYHNVMFIALLGNVVSGSVMSLRAAGADVNDTAEMALFVGTSGGTAGASNFDDKIVALDLVKPGKRYIEVQVFHVTQDAPFDAVIAIQYNGRTRPAVQGSTVIDSDTLVSPADA